MLELAKVRAFYFDPPPLSWFDHPPAPCISPTLAGPQSLPGSTSSPFGRAIAADSRHLAALNILPNHQDLRVIQLRAAFVMSAT